MQTIKSNLNFYRLILIKILCKNVYFIKTNFAKLFLILFTKNQFFFYAILMLCKNIFLKKKLEKKHALTFSISLFAIKNKNLTKKLNENKNFYLDKNWQISHPLTLGSLYLREF